ncbi:hypothetical protein [Bacillus taeanensis]|uniref:Uncharacterized protein n=1 Tax=Bacillus taeanensis TaxID=273032 RepID=A0A366XXU2_9BACI|nr:hypothetical protein [Bacillus taeanensis]RBW68964.1 hypothetical protein DS031_13575 [Bacillus taeanensis]
MGALTSQILVGQGNPEEGGINPSHYLYLSEDGLSVWSLVQTTNEVENDCKRVTWVSTPEHLLEDALLMIGLYVIKDHELKQMAAEYFTEKKGRAVVMLKEKDDRKEKLYRRARKIASHKKIILTVFHGSSVKKQIGKLRQYKMNIEVCTPLFLLD